MSLSSTGIHQILHWMARNISMNHEKMSEKKHSICTPTYDPSTNVFYWEKKTDEIFLF